MPTTPVVLAYFSPETLLPVTSVVATLVGVVMMFGRTVWRVVALRFRRHAPGPLAVRARSGPHFRNRGPVRENTAVRRL